jgi:hypothetical protein
MLVHLFNLIVLSIKSIPSALGSTWLGILFPIFVAIIGEIIATFHFGWQAMVNNWKKATGVAAVALVVGYTLLFLYCVVVNIYSIHTNLVTSNNRLTHDLAQNKNSVGTAVQAAVTAKDEEIGRLKLSCAQNEGAQGILQQQLTTCLLQQKETPIIRAFPISHDSSGRPRMEYVLTTNVVRTPVDLIASCDLAIAEADLVPLTSTGTGTLSMSKNNLSVTEYKFSFGSPAWSPSGPIFVTIFFVPPVNRMPSCSFTTE